MIAFRDNAGRSVVIGPGEARFQFVGQRLLDAAENSGPLFGGAPPRIRTPDGRWEGVGTIVVGSEGVGRSRWRIRFEPDPDLTEQLMPTEIVGRKAGWHFVRFYDLQDELIDSLDFRFGAGLQNIAVQPGSPFPSGPAHEAIIVELQHDSDWYVYRHPRTPGHVRIERSSGKTIITIPPEPEFDQTSWLLGPHEGPHVEITILAERVWWALSTGDSQPSQWRDIALPVSREDFTATSERAVWLRLPKPRWADEVFVGFHEGRRREYTPKVAASTVTIKLRDFSDSQELANRTEGHILRVWTRVNGMFHQGAVAIAAAEIAEDVLNIACVPASRLASVLVALNHASHGQLRRLIKKARRQYRRPKASRPVQNLEFVKEALCTMALFFQLDEVKPPIIPRSANRFRSRARVASRQFPETMKQVWRSYRELGCSQSFGLEFVERHE